VFPTKTYPNHYSIATGLYAGGHGIVANDFHDAAFNATYRLSDRSTVEDGRWYDGEPIWVTAERQGMVTAAMFFIGTEAPVQGIQPTYWNRYDHQRPNAERIATVLDWLRMPAERRPHIVTLYFSVLDDAGHRFGPDAPETMAALQEADALLSSLMDGIESLVIRNEVYLVIVSDHGMVATDRGTILLDDYTTFAPEDVVLSAGTITQIHVADEARRWRIASELSALPGATAYLREDLPEEWHIRENARIGDIVVVANEGVLLGRRGFPSGTSRATHGYAPMPSMHGIFLAAGPRIVPGSRISAFENVHIYPLLAEVLRLRPADDIDGDLDVLRSILRPARSNSSRGDERTSGRDLTRSSFKGIVHAFH
jgi:predicted AlkP superfamily pyrophosphatase or phosphodiesterase